MGKAWSSYVIRPLRNWNIENRAQRYIEKHEEKPAMAPRHLTTKDLIDQFTVEHPEIGEQLLKKDQQLANMLKGMVVNPEKLGEIVTKSTEKSHRPLPENRSKQTESEFGYLEPEVIRPGRCTIRQALQFLGDHLQDPTNVGSATSIAQKYNLDANNVKQVLRYFQVFNVHVPANATVPDAANQPKTLTANISPRLKGIADTKKGDDTKQPETTGTK